MHELDHLNAFSEGADIFDFRAVLDPSIVSRVPNVTVHERVLPELKTITKKVRS